MFHKHRVEHPTFNLLPIIKTKEQSNHQQYPSIKIRILFRIIEEDPNRIGFNGTLCKNPP